MPEDQSLFEIYVRDLQIDALEEEVKRLHDVLVECVVPYEALLLDAESQKWIAPYTWTAIEKAVIDARTVLEKYPHG